jgi:hypothetical protein
MNLKFAFLPELVLWLSLSAGLMGRQNRKGVYLEHVMKSHLLRYGPIVLVFCLLTGAFANDDANVNPSIKLRTGKAYLKQIVSWLPARW